MFDLLTPPSEEEMAGFPEGLLRQCRLGIIRRANGEVTWNLLASLARWFEVIIDDELKDELRLRPLWHWYARNWVHEITVLLLNLNPDEVSVHPDGSIRVWWD